MGLFEQSLAGNAGSLFSSNSASESRILGRELAFVRKLKEFGERRLFTSIFLFSLGDPLLLGEPMGSGELM